MSEEKEDFDLDSFIEKMKALKSTPSSYWSYSGGDDPFEGQYNSLEDCAMSNLDIDELCEKINYIDINVKISGIAITMAVKDRIRFLSRQLEKLTIDERTRIDVERGRFQLPKGEYTDDSFVFNYVMEADSRDMSKMIECEEWHEAAKARIRFLSESIESISLG